MGKAVSDMSAADLDEMGVLYEYEGQGVTAVGLEVRNAAGGLNDALDVEPTLHKIGDRFYVVMAVDVTGVNHKPIKGEEDKLRRIEVTRAVDAAFLDTPAVQKAIRETRTKIEKERERRAGVQRMFDDPEDPAGGGD